MKSWLKAFWKQLNCDHKYKFIEEAKEGWMADPPALCGVVPATYKCSKCNKIEIREHYK